ncbi:cupin domain-containing protein [Nonomuraea cavernae]|uniref:cupin domain-containing protein n=1 Tax=Nonomuraea cavernae TaxID=2045107 RepID=UPI0033E32075
MSREPLESSTISGNLPQLTEPFSLAWLLHPVSTTDFIRSYWETAPLVVHRETPDHFARLPGLDDVDELITATTSGPIRSVDDGLMVRTDSSGTRTDRRFRMDAGGMPDVQEAYRAYHDGFSIVLNRVHHRSGVVARLCRALEVSLHHPVGANLYLTPRDSQGFLPHADTHDVFILQLHGVKEWHVANPLNSLPLASKKSGPLNSFSGFRAFTLRPGDALYLPRGFPHEAVTGSSSSLHLTVGLHVFRWVDLVSEALALFADEHTGLRSALAPGFLDAPADAARLAALADELARAAISQPLLMERAKARLGARVRDAGKAAGSGHFRSIDAIAELTLDSVVVRAHGVLCRADSTAEEARVEFAGNYVSGPSFLAPALTFVAGHERFAVGELPGPLSAEDKIDLVGRLVSEGLLHCTDNDGDSSAP